MRVEVPRIASRERVTTLPNFRSAGRTVDRPLLTLLARLQQKHGKAFASEGGLRRMIAQDTGHCPGVSTLQKALVRLGKQGLLVQVWLRAGQILPDHGVASHGTRLVWLPQCRRQRLSARAWNAKQDRRSGHETRMSGHKASELVSKLAGPPAPPSYVPDTGKSLDTERARQLAALADWARKERPPDG